jgi:catecholate siderophore receptor
MRPASQQEPFITEITGKFMKKRASQQPSSASWPATARWLASGALAIYSAVGCQVVFAQVGLQQVGVQKDPAAVESILLSQAPTRRFDIAAGTLGDAIDAFSRTTGIAATFQQDGLRQLSSPGVIAVTTPEKALEALTKDTGVHWRFTGPQAVALALDTVTQTVTVSDSVSALPVSTPKFTEPLRDTPQTIDVVNQKTMQEQNVTTLRDALRNVAGISIAAGEGGAQGDNLTIRGFSARNDLYIDGMRDFGSYYRDPFDLEEVEVVQGPDSTNFGRGSTGGVVNQATKFPLMDRMFAGTFDGGTDGTRRLTTDFNTPLKGLGMPASFRLNVMGTEGGVAGRPVAHNRRYGVAPSLSFGLGTPTRVILSGLNQQADDVPDYGIPWLFNSPAPVSRHNYYGFGNGGNFLRTRDNIATLRIGHDFGAHFSLRNQSRYARYDRDVRITEPQATLTTTPGVAPTPSTPLANILVNRNELTSNSVESFLANQTDLTASFETGFIKHTVVTGYEVDREDSDPIRPKWTGVLTASLLNPDPTQPFTGVAAPSSNVHARSNTSAGYLSDTMKLGSHWQLSGSLRMDHFNTSYTQSVAPAAAYNRIDNMPSWHGAIVYKPIAPLSLYGSAGTSFNPSAESLSLSASTASLPPEKNRTVEFGAKWDMPGPRLSLRAAWFNTDKYNAREPDPTNSLLNVLAGSQRVRGIETGVTGHLTSRWDLQASYAYLDSAVVSSKAYPAAIGARLANVPRHTLAFWQTYKLPWRTTIGAGGNFVGSRTASSTVPLDPTTHLLKQAPGYWVFNAMAERQITERITLHANVYNIADRYYYDQLHPGHIVLGPARAALIGVKFRF